MFTKNLQEALTKLEDKVKRLDFDYKQLERLVFTMSDSLGIDPRSAPQSKVIQEIYDYLGVNRHQIPQSTKLIKKEKHL